MSASDALMHSGDPRPNAMVREATYSLLSMILGGFLCALGLQLYSASGLVLGNVAGLSLLLHYKTGIQFSTLFVVINTPFLIFAAWRMGVPVAARTGSAIIIVAIICRLQAAWLGMDWVAPAYAAVGGGAMIGLGILQPLRRRIGISGFTLFALMVRDRFSIPVGLTLLVLDLAILCGAFTVTTVLKVLLSIIGALIVNGLIWLYSE